MLRQVELLKSRAGVSGGHGGKIEYKKLGLFASIGASWKVNQCLALVVDISCLGRIIVHSTAHTCGNWKALP